MTRSCAGVQATTCHTQAEFLGQSISRLRDRSQLTALAMDKPETDLQMLSDREEFQDRLFWGRQRGLAIVFAAEAGSSDERSSSTT